MIRIQFFGLLRLLLRKESVELPSEPGDTVGRVLERAEKTLTGPIIHKLAAGGVLNAGTIILVNRRNVLHLQGLETPVNDGDTVALFPPGAGG